MRDNDDLADCRFWDFAGQREYYATHQTFLSPNAIYLLTMSLKDIIPRISQLESCKRFDEIDHVDGTNSCIFHCLEFKRLQQTSIFFLQKGNQKQNTFEKELLEYVFSQSKRNGRTK